VRIHHGETVIATKKMRILATGRKTRAIPIENALGEGKGTRGKGHSRVYDRKLGLRLSGPGSYPRSQKKKNASSGERKGPGIMEERENGGKEGESSAATEGLLNWI